MSTGLEFREEDHSYWLDGRRLAGTTETIAAVAPHRAVDGWYLDRGRAVHAAVALALAGQLDWSSVDERIVGRVRAVLRFIQECRIKPVFFERQFVSERYRFAGTLDFYGQMPDGAGILADWKGSLCPQVEIQMGSYSLLLSDHKEFPLKRGVGVQTNDDGSYKCKWFTTPQIRVAQQTFLAFLTCRNWLQTHNLTPKPPKP